MYDVAIVGGGPAGLAAGLVLGRSLRSAVVIDSAHPRNATASAVHNYLTQDGTSPTELAAIARAQLAAYSTVELIVDEATAITSDEDGFVVTTAASESFRSRRLVLATGLVDALPPIDGLQEWWGRGVFHCPYCHGYEVRGQAIAVFGANAGAVHLALHLSRYSHSVTLCTNGAELQTDDDLLLTRRHVRVRVEPVERIEGADGTIRAIIFDAAPALAIDALFVTPRTHQSSTLPARLGCLHQDDGTVEVDDFGRTSVAGVLAVGDMARPKSFPFPAAQVILAAASGTTAGIVLDQQLSRSELSDSMDSGARS